MNYIPPNQDPSSYYAQQQAGTFANADGRTYSGTFNGETITNNMSANMFANEDVNMIYGDEGDQGDSKRRRIARV